MKKILSFCLMMLLAIQVAFAEGKTTPSTSDSGNLNVETGGGNNKATDETQSRDGGSNDGDKKIITSQKYVDDELAKKQNKIGTQSGTYAVTYTNTAGTVTPRQVKTSLGTGTSDSALPTVSAVNAGLDLKQTKVPAHDSNIVVTYTENEGVISEKRIYQDDEPYASQADNLIEAGAFNTAVKTGLDSEFLCAGNSSGGDCWLWSIHNEGDGNLFDTSSGVIYGYPTASYTWYARNDATMELSVIVKLTEGSTYTATRAAGSGSTFRIQASSTPTLTNGQTLQNIDSTGAATVTTKTFTVPNGYPYVIFYLRNGQSQSSLSVDDCLNGFKLVYGSSATPVRPYETLVPSDYTPVEYLESTGTQYINTEVVPTLNTGAYVKAALTVQKSSDNVIFGATNAAAYAGGAPLSIDIFTSRVLLPHGGTSSSYAGNQINVANVVNTIYEFKINYMNNGLAEVNNTTKVLGTSTTMTTKPLYLFNLNSSSGGLSQYAPNGARFYDVILTENDEVSHHFIPVRRNSDGVLGMYDTVGNAFKTNAGSGTFTAGSDISNVVYIPQGE